MSIFVASDFHFIDEKSAESGSVVDFDFTNIRQDLRHLCLDVVGRGTLAAIAVRWNAEINGDTGSNYTRYVQWQGGNITQSAPGLIGNFTWTPSLDSPAGYFGNAFMKFFNYRNPNTIKTWQARCYDIETSVGSAFIYDSAGSWHSLAPINRIRIYTIAGLIAQYSSVQLYGIS